MIIGVLEETSGATETGVGAGAGGTLCVGVAGRNCSGILCDEPLLTSAVWPEVELDSDAALDFGRLLRRLLGAISVNGVASI